MTPPLMLLVALSRGLQDAAASSSTSPFNHASPLEAYFDSVRTGPGVWKWRNYFDVYHRHFARFQNTDVNFAEVGIYSGGSLLMWRKYLGNKAAIHGIDIANATLQYHQNPRYGSPEIHIGDQGDEMFWIDFQKRVPRIDILMDDGSHHFQGQNTTFAMMIDHIAPGGIYVCEDIHHAGNRFLQEMVQTFVTGKKGLNVMAHQTPHWQRTIAEVAFYPYMVVVEKLPAERLKMQLQRHGTEWQPPCTARARVGDSTCFPNLGSQGDKG